MIKNGWRKPLGDPIWKNSNTDRPGESRFGSMKKHQVVVRRNGSNSTTMARSVRYVECQKNHAANIGGYAVDGCREFMASGEEGTTGALTCAACGCHRNFHRREVQTEVVSESSS
ncbi:hypothetical protein F0562_024896 [Nyssa sinensis]|uniref:ZF-HD dimerization-type domain-containing protein n=1 Tax=Nyssa sinensis TaxID=561372 RepID=A0A5J5BEF0_9ASTE|nr:hypothetical protein F0562_024896 [Nyssa sinensis]